MLIKLTDDCYIDHKEINLITKTSLKSITIDRNNKEFVSIDIKSELDTQSEFERIIKETQEIEARMLKLESFYIKS